MRSQQEELIENRKLYLQTKRKNIFSRFRCKHDICILALITAKKFIFVKNAGKKNTVKTDLKE